ncbi:hypothetical protein FB45DRAFT_120109 [Roridomyces roridus]|uniref:Uncharacterized protein n=1 Tax=Roridomyces roridus TaxID=1738132 RepID=A0AAD7AXM0_9AGAR|nr:hypothetical protein FB45DRAFT_120109 [Roridomyces roridus]
MMVPRLRTILTRCWDGWVLSSDGCARQSCRCPPRKPTDADASTIPESWVTRQRVSPLLPILPSLTDPSLPILSRNSRDSHGGLSSDCCTATAKYVLCQKFRERRSLRYKNRALFRSTVRTLYIQSTPCLLYPAALPPSPPRAQTLRLLLSPPHGRKIPKPRLRASNLALDSPAGRLRTLDRRLPQCQQPQPARQACRRVPRIFNPRLRTSSWSTGSAAPCPAPFQNRKPGVQTRALRLRSHRANIVLRCRKPRYATSRGVRRR